MKNKCGYARKTGPSDDMTNGLDNDGDVCMAAASSEIEDAHAKMGVDKGDDVVDVDMSNDESEDGHGIRNSGTKDGGCREVAKGKAGSLALDSDDDSDSGSDSMGARRGKVLPKARMAVAKATLTTSIPPKAKEPVKAKAKAKAPAKVKRLTRGKDKRIESDLDEETDVMMNDGSRSIQYSDWDI